MFELLSSIVEVSGFIIIAIALALGLFNPWIFFILIISILLYSFTVTISALMIEKYTLDKRKGFWLSLKLLIFSLLFVFSFVFSFL